MTILDGKALSIKIKNEIKCKTDEIIKNGDKIPCLAVVFMGDDPASQIYVRNKIKSCTETGITSKQYILSSEASQKELLELIENLNNDVEVNGILVQLPLPDHIDERAVINTISPKKDVDVFHPFNAGNLFLSQKGLSPCTPSGIIRLLDEYGIEIEGKNCVIVGRSNIVGKPIAMLLLQRNGTVTICHSRTKNLENYIKNAEILVAAVGKPKLITGDMIKDGAIIIDVGMNRSDGKLCGDVDFESCKDKASYITPVPGGVGPMTIAILLENTLKTVL